MALSYSTRVGVAIVSSFNAIPSASLVTHPVEPPTFNRIWDAVNDQTVRGDPVLDYNVYQGVSRSEATIDSPFYPEESGYFLKALMGSEVFTSGTTTGTHVFTGYSAPSAVCFFVADDTFGSPPTSSYAYTGMYCSSFGLKFNAGQGILSLNSTWTGSSRSVQAIVPAAMNTSNPIQPWLGYQATVTYNSGTATWSSRLLDFECTINRPTALLYTATNTQYALRADAGPIELTGRMTFDYIDPNYFVDIDANTEVEFIITFTRGSGTSTRTLTLDLQRTHLIEGPAEVQRNNVALALQVPFRAVGVSGWKSPVQFTLVNANNNKYP